MRRRCSDSFDVDMSLTHKGCPVFALGQRWILAFMITGFSTVEMRLNIRSCDCLKASGIEPQDAEAVVNICAS